MHWIFALHYAREFYGASGDKHAGGLLFPGKEDPDYWDFLYYSLVVAMTAQVSDVQITSKTIRRLTTVHGVASFFFNVAVLLLNAQRTDDAIVYLTKSITLDPNFADGYFQRGLAYLGTGKTAEARADLEKFIALAPADSRADMAKKALEQLPK